MAPRTFVLVAVVGALAACGPRPGNVGGPVQCALGPSQTVQALAQYVPSQIVLHTDDPRLSCEAAAGACATACAIDVGNVAEQSDTVVDVAIQNPSIIALEIFDASLDGDCHDFYLEGQPPNEVSAHDEAEVSLVYRPSAPGPCAATLRVASDAGNLGGADRGAVSLALKGNGVATRAGLGCSTRGACCCALGAQVDAPACVDDVIECTAGGSLAFDDACDVSPCAP